MRALKIFGEWLATTFLVAMVLNFLFAIGFGLWAAGKFISLIYGDVGVLVYILLCASALFSLIIVTEHYS